MPNANTSVFTGADASITLAKSQGPEGEAAQKVIDGFNLLTVGRARNVSVQVRSEIHPFNELGQRYATQLRAATSTELGLVRPLNCALDSSRARELLHTPLRGVRTVLAV